MQPDEVHISVSFTEQQVVSFFLTDFLASVASDLVTPRNVFSNLIVPTNTIIG